jgi:hypothetical protein
MHGGVGETSPPAFVPPFSEVFPDQSSFSVLRETPMAFATTLFKKLKCYYGSRFIANIPLCFGPCTRGLILERAFLLSDMLMDFLNEIFDQPQNRRSSPYGKGTVGLVHPPAHAFEEGNELLSPFPVFDTPQQVLNITKPLSAWRAIAAGFSGEKLNEIQGGAH